MITNNYRSKVELLIRIIPAITEEEDLAIHGGTAINLFVKDLPRYSIDIDLTYVRILGRTESIDNINACLRRISEKLKQSIKGIQIAHRPDICKLLCSFRGSQVKIEVNQTKRGVISGTPQVTPLCTKAQDEFGMYCEANVVPIPLLYGGKIAAALSRQHPRDLFDVKYMDYALSDVKEGILYSLLGSDRPISESISPNLIDQTKVMETQFMGMTDTPFTYQDYEVSRSELIQGIQDLFSESEKDFLISFESGTPQWSLIPYPSFEQYPSVEWKLLNINKLKEKDSASFAKQIAKLKEALGR